MVPLQINETDLLFLKSLEAKYLEALEAHAKVIEDYDRWVAFESSPERIEARRKESMAPVRRRPCGCRIPNPLSEKYEKERSEHWQSRQVLHYDLKHIGSEFMKSEILIRLLHSAGDSND